VDVKINRFALSGRNVVAHGVLTSRVEGAGDSQAARKRVTFAVSAQAGRCHVLTLTLDDLQLDLLGLRVDLSGMNLRIFAVPRGEGSRVLGRLFCALSRSTHEPDRLAARPEPARPRGRVVRAEPERPAGGPR